MLKTIESHCIVLEGTTPADDIDTENGTVDHNDAENEIADDTYTKMLTADYILKLKIELQKKFELEFILLMVLIQIIELLMAVMLKI